MYSRVQGSGVSILVLPVGHVLRAFYSALLLKKSLVKKVDVLKRKRHLNVKKKCYLKINDFNLRKMPHSIPVKDVPVNVNANESTSANLVKCYINIQVS